MSSFAVVLSFLNISFPKYLVPSLKESIQNPHNLIEDVASNGWIRGGIPSRDLSRDKDYLNKQ